ncbi:hypothetical protein F5B19DRAFT_469562 [Rostrohypoxylon terebratum]|nr:hypothetical protein F5B19DRAFT_469562 [Rostrohypoxylon terebratum]
MNDQSNWHGIGAQEEELDDAKKEELIEALLQDGEVLSDEVDRLDKENKQLRESIAQLQQTQTQTQSNDNGQQLRDLQQTNEKLLQNILQWQQSYKQLEESHIQLQQTQTQAQNNDNNQRLLENTNNMLEQSNTQLQKQNNELRDSIVKWQQGYNQLQASHHQLQQTQTQAQNNDNNQRLEQTNTQLQKENNELRKNILQWQQSYKQLEESHTQLQQTQTQEQNSNALQQINKQLQQSLTKLQENYNRLHAAHNGLQVQNKQFRQEIQDLRQNIPESQLVKTLRDNNTKLKEHSKILEDHIFDLTTHSARTEIFPKEAEDKYKFRISGISEFVQQRMSSLINNRDHQNKAKTWAQEGMYDLRHEFSKFPDLHKAILNFGLNNDIDEEVLVAFIIRRMQAISKQGLVAAVYPELDRVLREAEQGLKNENRLTEIQLRSWRAETRIGLLHSLIFQQRLHQFRDQFLNQTAHLLGFLAMGDEDHATFVGVIANFINPLLDLEEQFMTTASDLTLDLQTLFPLGQNFTGTIADLTTVQATNILDNNRELKVSGTNSASSEERLHKELYIICSLRPSLRFVDAKDTYIAPEKTLIKEQLLVAWKAGQDPTSVLSSLTRKYGQPILYGLLTTQ